MAGMDESKVISQQNLEHPASPRPSKRRQSSTSDLSVKRPRLSSEASASSPAANKVSPDVLSPTGPAKEPSKDASPERRKTNLQEEKKRGRRLYGGLLSTLSQTTGNTQQKERRKEIEKKQQERAKVHKAEEESRRIERLKKLKESRALEQVKFDEQSMRIRHSNMLAMAQFLCTKTEPKLYYKPWELLPADTERIEAQISATEALIDREVREFKERHKPDVTPAEKPLEETAGEHQEESLSTTVATAAITDSTNLHPPAQVSESSIPVGKDHVHENSEVEVLVEDGEDAVMY